MLSYFKRKDACIIDLGGFYPFHESNVTPFHLLALGWRRKHDDFSVVDLSGLPFNWALSNLFRQQIRFQDFVFAFFLKAFFGPRNPKLVLRSRGKSYPLFFFLMIIEDILRQKYRNFMTCDLTTICK